MEKIINQIISEMNNRTNNKEFAIVRFQPNNILLLHKPTKKTYQYLEPLHDTPLLQHINHPTLIRPIVYNNGLLYPRGLSTLETELQNRRRAHTFLPFQQTEIIHTFLPILDCLQFLHQKGIVHGGVTPASIIFTEDEEIKVKDWMADCKENIYYTNKKMKDIQQEDDLAALGHIIAQATTLRKGVKVFQEKDLTHILQSIVDKYSKGFLFALAVLLKKNKERFELLHHFFHNEQKYLGDLELNSLYDTVKREKERKKKLAVTNENIIPASLPIKGIISLTESPAKKIVPHSSLNNTIKRTKDDENKKGVNEDSKRKQIQKINKIIERSNQFVNELMARKNNEQILKKIAPKPNIAANISMFSEGTKKLGKEMTIQISPTKRIRTNSKKK